MSPKIVSSNVSHVSAVKPIKVDQEAELTKALTVEMTESAKKKITAQSDSSIANPVTPAPEAEEMDSIIKEVNTDLDYVQKNLHFRIHEETGEMMVEVTNVETGEVIRTLPPEQFLDVLGRIRNALGAFIDEEV